MSLAAHVYAEQLLPRGHGYPLWFPEPSATQLGEIRIGDVGYVWDGSFFRLFNITLPEDHLVNKKHGVPGTFAHLQDWGEEWSMRRTEGYLGPGAICSQTVKRVEVKAQAAVEGPSVAPAGAGIGARYRCARDKGALLVLNNPVSQEILGKNTLFPDYMSRHYESWYEFAKSKGHQVSPDEIFMVRGSVKTARWAVAAFLDESREHEYQLEVSGGPVVSASAAISVTLSNATAMSVEYRIGPPTGDEEDNELDPSEGDASSRPVEKKTGAKLPRNQCVFLSRYKIRYRKFFWPGKQIQAAAGPSDLGDAPPHDANVAVIIGSFGSDGKRPQVEGEGERRLIKDPVDALLEYILAHSDCEAAVASDEDVRTIVERQPVGRPEMEPPIGADDNIADFLHADDIIEVSEIDRVGCLKLSFSPIKIDKALLQIPAMLPHDPEKLTEHAKDETSIPHGGRHRRTIGWDRLTKKAKSGGEKQDRERIEKIARYPVPVAQPTPVYYASMPMPDTPSPVVPLRYTPPREWPTNPTYVTPAPLPQEQSTPLGQPLPQPALGNNWMNYFSRDTHAHTVAERLKPTLEHAQNELVKARRRARISDWSIKILLFTLVLLGVATTALGAFTGASSSSRGLGEAIATTVLGGLTAVAAAAAARLRSPSEAALSKCQDLEYLIREMEAVALDLGNMRGSEHDGLIQGLRRRFEEIVGR